jgi:hypothetical protein
MQRACSPDRQSDGARFDVTDHASGDHGGPPEEQTSMGAFLKGRPGRASKPSRAALVVAFTFSIGIGGAIQSIPALADGETWVAKSPMLVPRWAMGSGVIAGTVYAVGGSIQYPDCSYSSRVEAYDTATDSWSVKPSMSIARDGPGVGVINGILYAVGGGIGCGVYTASVEAFEPLTGIWSPRTSLSKPRYHLAVVALNGLLYAVGGDLSTCDATMEAYDPLTNTWTPRASIPPTRCWNYYLSGGAVNGRLYAVSLANGEWAVAAYDPATDTWTMGAVTPGPGPGCGLQGGAIGGRLYLAGNGASKSYDPAADAWAASTPLPDGTACNGAAVVGGTLYMYGGTHSVDPDCPAVFGATCIENATYALTPAPAPVGPPATLTLAPAAATNTVGQQHCVTATVTDASGNSTPGVIIHFDVVGAQATFSTPSSGTRTTNGEGQATFCFSASLPGENAIHAFADSNANGSQDAAEPFGDATKTWTPPTSTQLCAVTITDGGWITANNGDRASFGGNAKVLPDGTVQGQQEYQDQGPMQRINVHSITITATTCSADRTTASIFGRATIDGAGSHVFAVDLTDLTSAGGTDSYGIMLDTGYTSGQQPLGGGEITIH